MACKKSKAGLVTPIRTSQESRNCQKTPQWQSRTAVDASRLHSSLAQNVQLRTLICPSQLTFQTIGPNSSLFQSFALAKLVFEEQKRKKAHSLYFKNAVKNVRKQMPKNFASMPPVVYNRKGSSHLCCLFHWIKPWTLLTKILAKVNHLHNRYLWYFPFWLMPSALPQK